MLRAGDAKIQAYLSRFCSKDCERRYRRRAAVRGQRLYETAMRWRGAKRSHSKGAKSPPGLFNEVTGLLDEFLRDDREMREDAVVRFVASTPISTDSRRFSSRGINILSGKNR